MVSPQDKFNLANVVKSPDRLVPRTAVDASSNHSLIDPPAAVPPRATGRQPDADRPARRHAAAAL
jgi:hypothetical protein